MVHQLLKLFFRLQTFFVTKISQANKLSVEKISTTRANLALSSLMNFHELLETKFYSPLPVLACSKKLPPKHQFNTLYPF
jgi:hypothetical protein